MATVPSSRRGSSKKTDIKLSNLRLNQDSALQAFDEEVMRADTLNPNVHKKLDQQTTAA